MKTGDPLRIGFGIHTITLGGKEDGGWIISNLHDDDTEDPHKNEYTDEMRYSFLIDGIESLILACYCAGIDVADDVFVSAIETAVDAAKNQVQ